MTGRIGLWLFPLVLTGIGAFFDYWLLPRVFAHILDAEVYPFAIVPHFMYAAPVIVAVGIVSSLAISRQRNRKMVGRTLVLTLIVEAIVMLIVLGVTYPAGVP